MRQLDFHTEEREIAIKQDILAMYQVDGIPLKEMNEWAGFTGARSLENILKDDTKTLSAGRLSAILSHAFSVYRNRRLFRHFVDLNKWMMVPRPNFEEVKGSLDDMIMIAIKALVKAGDTYNEQNLITAYDQLMLCLARIRAEALYKGSLLAKREVG